MESLTDCRIIIFEILKFLIFSWLVKKTVTIFLIIQNIITDKLLTISKLMQTTSRDYLNHVGLQMKQEALVCTVCISCLKLLVPMEAPSGVALGIHYRTSDTS